MVLQTTASKPRYALSAVSELLERGAHFVLAARWGDLKEDRTQSKKPVWTAWPDRRPDFTAVKDHLDRDGLLGIVPASLGMAVLDVDTGDATQLIVDYPPGSSPGRSALAGCTSGTGIPRKAVAGATGAATAAPARSLPPPVTSSSGTPPWRSWPRPSAWATSPARARRPFPRWRPQWPGGRPCPRPAPANRIQVRLRPPHQPRS